MDNTMDIYIIVKSYNDSDGGFGEEVLGYTLSEEEAKSFLANLTKDSACVKEDANTPVCDFKFRDEDYELKSLSGVVRRGHVCEVTYTEYIDFAGLEYDYSISYKKINRLK